MAFWREYEKNLGCNKLTWFVSGLDSNFGLSITAFLNREDGQKEGNIMVLLVCYCFLKQYLY
jgi:hypothetical protein